MPIFMSLLLILFSFSYDAHEMFLCGPLCQDILSLSQPALESAGEAVTCANWFTYKPIRQKKITLVQGRDQVCVTVDGACVDLQVRSILYTPRRALHVPVPLEPPALRLFSSEKPHACDHPPGRAAAQLTRGTPGGSA